jgi:hypothetical protein
LPIVCQSLGTQADTRRVTDSEETYIVRVRPAEQDAVVEDVRTRERIHVRELGELGALIARRVERRARLARRPDGKEAAR